MAIDVRTHWEKIYTTKASDQVRWYRPHLETSLALIKRSASDRTASVIDVGRGESNLVDDLLEEGFQNITVLDVSQAAIDVNKTRLGEKASGADWLVADITQVELEPKAYDVRHDRAVFHFLTAKEHRAAYVRQVARSVKPGGHVMVSTFGPAGPTRCSGLDAVRYADSLHDELVHASAWWKARRNCIRHGLVPRSSSSITTAGWGEVADRADPSAQRRLTAASLTFIRQPPSRAPCRNHSYPK